MLSRETPVQNQPSDDRTRYITSPGIGQPAPGPLSGDFAAGEIVAGSYKIVGLIGRGGMGTVYRVQHIFLDKELALKTLSGQHITDVAWRRFQIEGQAIARLDHTHIIRIYDLGIAGQNQPYYVMDLVDGQSLSQLIKEKGALSPQLALPIFRQVSAGLAYAHEHGIIHRDLKPANIMLVFAASGPASPFGSAATSGPASTFGSAATSGLAAASDSCTSATTSSSTSLAGIAFGTSSTSSTTSLSHLAGNGKAIPVAKILDFGLAKLTDLAGGAASGLTKTGEVFGSPLYMSPEQGQGQSVDHTTDIYSFGCSLFEALTGEVPFKGSNAINTMLLHQSATPPRLGEVRPDLVFSHDLERMVAKMLAKRKENRYGSFAEIAQLILQLERFPEKGLDHNEFERNRFENSKFENNKFENSKFENNKFENNKFENNKFENSKFENSKFENSSFENKNIYNRSDEERSASPLDYDQEYTTPPPPGITSRIWFWPATMISSGLLLIILATSSYLFFSHSSSQAHTGNNTNIAIPAILAETAQKTKIGNHDNHSPTNALAAEDNTHLSETPYYSHTTNTNGGGTITFDFPQDKSLGIIKIDVQDGERIKLADAWQKRHGRLDRNPYVQGVEAQGTMSFPMTDPLAFTPSAETCLTPLIFKKFRPDDFTFLDFRENENVDSDLLYYIKHLKRLKVIILCATNVNDKAFKVLDQLPNLRYVNFDETAISVKAFSESATIKRIQRLSWQRCPDVDELLRALARKGNIIDISLDHNRITSVTLKEIALLPKLNQICLNSCDVGDEGVRLLSMSKSLTELDCSDPNITAKSIPVFASMPLKSLQISGQGWSGRDWARLTEAMRQKHCYLMIRACEQLR